MQKNKKKSHKILHIFLVYDIIVSVSGYFALFGAAKSDILTNQKRNV